MGIVTGEGPIPAEDLNMAATEFFPFVLQNGLPEISCLCLLILPLYKDSWGFLKFSSIPQESVAGVCFQQCGWKVGIHPKAGIQLNCHFLGTAAGAANAEAK